MFPRIIELNPTSPEVLGRYQKEDPIVYLVCDAANGPFTISLPGSGVLEQPYWIIQKIDDSSNEVTIVSETPSDTLI